MNKNYLLQFIYNNDKKSKVMAKIVNEKHCNYTKFLFCRFHVFGFFTGVVQVAK